MITIGYETYDGRNRWDRGVLKRFLPYEEMRYRPAHPAFALLDRALDAGIDITPAIEALDALDGDCDLEPIDEREPEEDGPNWQASDQQPIYEVCHTCGHMEQVGFQ